MAIVVLEFIKSCHVLEKLNKGPVAAQTITTLRAIKNATGCPAIDDVFAENR